MLGSFKEERLTMQMTGCSSSIVRARKAALTLLALAPMLGSAQSPPLDSLAQQLRERYRDRPDYAWLVHTTQHPNGILEALDAAVRTGGDQSSVVISPLGQRTPGSAMFFAVVPPSPTRDSEIPVCVDLAGAIQGYWLLTQSGVVQEVDWRGESGCFLFIENRNARFRKGAMSHDDLRRRSPFNDLGLILEAHYSALAARTLSECAGASARVGTQCDAAAHFAQIADALRSKRQP